MVNSYLNSVLFVTSPHSTMMLQPQLSVFSVVSPALGHTLVLGRDPHHRDATAESQRLITKQKYYGVQFHHLTECEIKSRGYTKSGKGEEKKSGESE